MAAGLGGDGGHCTAGEQPDVRLPGVFFAPGAEPGTFQAMAERVVHGAEQVVGKHRAHLAVLVGPLQTGVLQQRVCDGVGPIARYGHEVRRVVRPPLLGHRAEQLALLVIGALCDGFLAQHFALTLSPCSLVNACLILATRVGSVSDEHVVDLDLCADIAQCLQYGCWVEVFAAVGVGQPDVDLGADAEAPRRCRKPPCVGWPAGRAWRSRVATVGVGGVVKERELVARSDQCVVLRTGLADQLVVGFLGLGVVGCVRHLRIRLRDAAGAPGSTST